MAQLAALLPSESSFAGAPTDSCSNTISVSSTPPTSISDSGDLPANVLKPEIETVIALLEQPAAAVPADPENHVESILCATEPQIPPDSEPETESVVQAALDASDTLSRPRRSRLSAPVVYNLAKLSGTAHHGHRRSKGDIVAGRRRRTASANDAAAPGLDGDQPANDTANKLVMDSIDALDMDWSVGSVCAPKSPSRSLRKRELAAQNPELEAGKFKKAVRAVSTSIISHRSTRRSSAGAAVVAATATATATNGLTEQLASMSKRARKSFEQSHSSMLRELKRLADTKEFAKVEEKPVITTIWANGKYYDSVEAADAARDAANAVFKGKGGKGQEATGDAAATAQVLAEAVEVAEAKADEQLLEPESCPVLPPPKKRQKKWLDKGLYAGQVCHDSRATLTKEERANLNKLPFLGQAAKENRSLPLPMFNGLRLLMNGRDFKLPYDVCHPLMDQPKPKEWRKITKSRFVGDSLSLWKKKAYFDNRSTCVCKQEDGCGEDCLNRSVLYECNDHNCNVGREHCQNRAFQDLQDRTKKGGNYRVGVEVFHTGSRGFGVRANRCFEPGQIIMEYAGEIITEEECERRMNEVYKDNKAYYLMSFDQNMILDATTGSIARFVNHSCSPNCRMIKWIVSGAPRMALFAGDSPIMTGDELTYDYNFDPFSAKNVQKCLCGSENCRGVLGPKTRNDNASKAASGNGSAKAKGSPKSGDSKKQPKQGVKATVKAGKRKLRDLLHGADEAEDAASASPAKKHKAKTAAAGLKRSISTASFKVAKGAARTATKMVKRGVSSITVSAGADDDNDDNDDNDDDDDDDDDDGGKDGDNNQDDASPSTSVGVGVKKSITRRVSTSTLLTMVSKAAKKKTTTTTTTTTTPKPSAKGKTAAVVAGKKHTPKMAAKSTTAKKSATKGKAAPPPPPAATPIASPRKQKTQSGKKAAATPSSRSKAAGKGEIVVKRREPSPRSRKPTTKLMEAGGAAAAVSSSSTLKPQHGSGVHKPAAARRKSTGGALPGKSSKTKLLFSGRQSTLGSFIKKKTAKAAPTPSRDAASEYEVPDSPRQRAHAPPSPPRPGRKALEIPRSQTQIRLVPNDDEGEDQ